MSSKIQVVSFFVVELDTFVKGLSCQLVEAVAACRVRSKAVSRVCCATSSTCHPPAPPPARLPDSISFQLCGYDIFNEPITEEASLFFLCVRMFFPSVGGAEST